MLLQNLYDLSAPKRATNLTVNGDLLVKVRELNLNLSRVFENALVGCLVIDVEEKWKVKNKGSIKKYNELVTDGQLREENDEELPAENDVQSCGKNEGAE